jgi:4-aminobutyrate aminotransferase
MNARDTHQDTENAQSQNAQLNARRSAATPRGISVMTQCYAHHALNSEFWDVEGRRYIDFAAGIAVLNTGHRHPRVERAIAKQLMQFTHTCYQVVPYSCYVELAERLNALVPGDFAKKTAFFTTGAEAVENAIKIARYFTKRPGVIALTGAFHGRTFMGLSLTGKVAPYKSGFGPMFNDIYHIPMPIELHGVSVRDSLNAIERLFKADVDPRQIAAIIVEPVQGEGGFYALPADFLRAIRTLCNEHGILMIADEVQTGFARTGKLFAMEHSGVAPDLVTMAKSLGGGMPISAVTGRADIMDAPAPGGLGGTYAGNPLSIAAALAVLDVIADEHLCERATVLGKRLMDVLETAKASQPRIAQVRGIGAMVAVEFNTSDGKPDAEFTQAVQQRALKAGLLLLSCGVYGNVIRFLFPLTIEDKVFEEAMSILKQALQS